MSHTYVSHFVHVVFATQERRSWIDDRLRPALHAYLGGIANANGFVVRAVGGTDDHVHALLSLSGAMPIAKAVQLIKGGSSKWIHEQHPHLHDFAWQEGYGAFTIGVSQIDDTVAYLANQIEHHRQRTFQEELAAFLSRHGIEPSSHDHQFNTARH